MIGMGLMNARGSAGGTPALLCEKRNPGESEILKIPPFLIILILAKRVFGANFPILEGNAIPE